MTETKSENCDLDALTETVSDEAADKWDEEFEHASRQLSEAYENLDPETKAWLEQRKEAAKSIDAETAEVNWMYAQTLDPYGVIKDFPEALYQIGREYFARAPGNDIWVEFGDLPESVREKLWEMHRHKLAFPAGLSDVLPWEDTAE